MMNLFLALVLVIQSPLVFGCCTTCCLTPQQVVDIREKYNPGFWYIRPAHCGPLPTKATTKTTPTTTASTMKNVGVPDTYGAPSSGGTGGGYYGHYGYPRLSYWKRNAEMESSVQVIFDFCNTDDVQGLSWNEVEACENEFCLKGVDFPCPSKVDFELMDGNLDGNLTMDEYMTFIQSN